MLGFFASMARVAPVTASVASGARGAAFTGVAASLGDTPALGPESVPDCATETGEVRLYGPPATITVPLAVTWFTAAWMVFLARAGLAPPKLSLPLTST